MTVFKHLASASAISATALILSTSPFWAQDALYSDVAPEDAVFVRLLDQDLTQVDMGGDIVERAPDVGTAYIAISQSELKTEPAARHLSYVLDDNGTPRAIPEPDREDLSKVHLMLLNSASEQMRLIIADNKMQVIAPTDSFNAASRAVNPVSVVLAVQRVSDGAILSEFDLRLSRGQNVTFLAKDDQAVLIENSFGPVMSLTSGG